MTTTSPLEAVKRFQDHPDRFDLIITDMTMPSMTGVELAKRVMDIRPDIPIILCTGHSELIDEQRAKSLGIREFLTKPIFIQDLALIVRHVLDENRDPISEVRGARETGIDESCSDNAGLQGQSIRIGGALRSPRGKGLSACPFR